MRGNVVAVVGAQFGSEAKGLIVSKIADQFQLHIRTGGPNAGHTHFFKGHKFVARSIPCGWTNPDATLVIGPGATIDPAVLYNELEEIEASDLPEAWSVRERLCIDRRATIITPAQHKHEGGVDGNAHEKIGSTGEGVGLARMARINRGSLLDHPTMGFVSAGELDMEFWVDDTVLLVNDMIDNGAKTLLEGTQGSGLSLTYGPWPYCTSTDTNAGQMAVDAGISPSLVSQTILVARTFPIRVAGNSGPLPNESSWEELGFTPERTTVTKKIRRIARWDRRTVENAIRLNRPAALAVTFLNYLFPETAGVLEYLDLSDRARDWLSAESQALNVPIVMIGTGPDEVIIDWVAMENHYERLVQWATR